VLIPTSIRWHRVSTAFTPLHRWLLPGVVPPGAREPPGNHRRPRQSRRCHAVGCRSRSAPLIGYAQASSALQRPDSPATAEGSGEPPPRRRPPPGPSFSLPLTSPCGRCPLRTDLRCFSTRLVLLATSDSLCLASPELLKLTRISRLLPSPSDLQLLRRLHTETARKSCRSTCSHRLPRLPQQHSQIPSLSPATRTRFPTMMPCQAAQLCRAASATARR